MTDILASAMEVIQGVDTTILLALNSLHTPASDTFMRIVSMRSVWIPLYLLLFLMVWHKYGWKAALLCAVSTGLAVAAADQLCGNILRGFLGRLRPSNPDNPISQWVHIVNNYRGGRYGFPSCHAANTAAVATLLSVWLRKKWVTLTLIGWCLTVSTSRIFLGVHYPGDVLAGLIIGVTIAVVFHRLLIRVCLRKAQHHWPRLSLPIIPI